MGVRISPPVQTTTMEKLRNYWNETMDELLHKVSWPTWDELRSSTVIVLIASLIFALVVYLIDVVAGFGLNTFYDLFK